MNETAKAEVFTFSTQTTESSFRFWFPPFPRYFPRPLVTGGFSLGSPFSEDGMYPGVTFDYIGFLKDRFLLRAWEDFTRPGHAQHATSPPLTLTVAAWELGSLPCLQHGSNTGTASCAVLSHGRGHVE